jgi:hypothetical protein
VIDLVQAQKDIVGILLSSDQLININVFSFRENRIKQEMDYRTMLTKPRNGRTGAFIMVLMPVANERNPNVSGPVLTWDFPIVTVENDTLNFVPTTGTLQSAEMLGQIVMDVMHHEEDQKLGTFQTSSKAMDPEKEYVFPGCIAYRNVFTILGNNIQTTRFAPVAMSVGATMITTSSCAPGSATLTCTTAGARIKYTLDGSHPSEDLAGNSASSLYTAPILLSSGDILRTAAYKAGMNKSSTRYVAVI